MDIIKLSPVFKETIWGGKKLRDIYGYDIPSDHTGECWAVSAHENGDCKVSGGTYEGMYLSELWSEHREIFGGMKGDRFPLLTKIIDANDDLSIQVHPDDEYAYKNENGSLGKTESWYVLDCSEDSTIINGHNATSHEELAQMIRDKKWNELLREIPVHKGDFLQIIPGTIHAIKKGTMVLEIQQSCDIIYRLYDYDRLSDGKPRPLHIRKSLDVINVPHREYVQSETYGETQNEWFEQLISCRYYNVWKAVLDGDKSLIQEGYFMIGSCLEGEAVIGNTGVKKGEHFIVPSLPSGRIRISGNAEFIISSPNE